MQNASKLNEHSNTSKIPNTFKLPVQFNPH